jgi:glycosyltransferase involved in cell wall biosynthesis
MKVALVHDYIKEFGGAERVLEALCEIYPDAPIYTAFYTENGTAFPRFEDRDIRTSWFNYIPYCEKLASPLRFLIPWIWGRFDFKDYDLVISSASWYVTKGFKKEGNKFTEICYCHTPPRWLYGYSTSVNFQKYRIIKLYALFVGHFLRMYDFKRAQKVDHFIANSKEVASRIEKFYRRDATVIYPPVSIPTSRTTKKGNYYFIVSRIVGAKGLDLAVDAAVRMGIRLKIAGSPAGYYFEYNNLLEKARGRVQFLGQVDDRELAKLYKEAKGFLALSRDEDFGITPVESMMAGTPVIAFNGGGYKETVVDGRTGVLFDDYSVEGLMTAIRKFEKTKFNSAQIQKHAQKFGKERFKKEFSSFIKKYA